METDTAQTTHWRSNVLIILAVLGAILLALILAQLDNLNELISPLPTAVAGIDGSGSGGTDGSVVVQPTPIPSQTPLPTNTNTPESSGAMGAETPTATPTTIPGQCNNTPVNWIPYVVQKGDTLYSLSIRSGASMDAIKHANCLESDHLVAGTVIYLPSTPPVLPPCGPPSYWIVYSVQYGDTLYSLATRTGTTVYAIMRANCLYNTYIYAGQKLYLPTYPPVPTATATGTAVPTATATITSTPPMTTTVTATATGTIIPTATATSTSTVDPTWVPTTTASATWVPTVAPTTTATWVPTLAPPTATWVPTAYPPGPQPTLPPPPTAYP